MLLSRLNSASLQYSVKHLPFKISFFVFVFFGPLILIQTTFYSDKSIQIYFNTINIQWD